MAEDKQTELIKIITELMKSRTENEIELFIKELEELVKTFT